MIEPSPWATLQNAAKFLTFAAIAAAPSTTAYGQSSEVSGATATWTLDEVQTITTFEDPDTNVTITRSQFDDRGGSIYFAVRTPDNTECYAEFIVQWQFFGPLDAVQHGITFEVSLGLIGQSTPSCDEPLTTAISVHPLSDSAHYEETFGAYSRGERRLFQYDSDEAGNRTGEQVEAFGNVVTSGSETAMMVDDTVRWNRSHWNAERGMFYFEISVAGSTFETYYPFSIQ